MLQFESMQSVAQIPFWLRGPNITAGQVIKNPVLTIDIAPTLLELAGVTTSTEQQDMDGLSICPLVLSNGTNTTATNTGNQVALVFHTMSFSFTLLIFREAAYLRTLPGRIFLTRPS